MPVRGQRPDQALRQLQQTGVALSPAAMRRSAGSSPCRVRPSRRKNSTTLRVPAGDVGGDLLQDRHRALAAAVVDRLGDVEPLARARRGPTPGWSPAARRYRGSPSRRRSRSTGLPTSGRCCAAGSAPCAPMRLTISRSGPLRAELVAVLRAVDRRQQVPQLVGVVDRVVVGTTVMARRSSQVEVGRRNRVIAAEPDRSARSAGRRRARPASADGASSPIRRDRPVTTVREARRCGEAQIMDRPDAGDGQGTRHRSGCR